MRNFSEPFSFILYSIASYHSLILYGFIDTFFKKSFHQTSENPEQVRVHNFSQTHRARKRQLSASCDNCIVSFMGYECVCVNLFLLHKFLGAPRWSFNPWRDASVDLHFNPILQSHRICQLFFFPFIYLFILVTGQCGRLKKSLSEDGLSQ